VVAYRHGLRATEIAELEWSQAEWGRSPALHVRRKKNGKPTDVNRTGDHSPQIDYNLPESKAGSQFLSIESTV